MQPAGAIKPPRRAKIVFTLLCLILPALLLVGSCGSDLPIEPEESQYSEAGIKLSLDAVNFDPTFLGRVSAVQVDVEYGDTLDMTLHFSTTDTVHFRIDPDSLTFGKHNQNRSFTVLYEPDVVGRVDTAHIFMATTSLLDTLDNIPDTVGLDSLRLAGTGRGFYLDMEMVFIPGGTFVMGTDSAEAAQSLHRGDEWPVHEVTLSDFFIGSYEVSNIQYYEFWQEVKPEHTPEDTSAVGLWPDVALDKPNFPVIGVSWEDAMAFCRWLSLRTGERYTLPTEAQWEYVATGGGGREYPWSLTEGEEPDTTQDADAALANVRRGGDGFTFTAPVDAFTTGASAFGPLNMSGNVWEWCRDWYDAEYYRSQEVFVDPTGSTDPESMIFRVIRGGSWLDDITEARCSNRGALAPENREINTGFRVIREP